MLKTLNSKSLVVKRVPQEYFCLIILRIFMSFLSINVMRGTLFVKSLVIDGQTIQSLKLTCLDSSYE